LKELKKLGFSNLSDLELPYWEPRYLHESKESYDRRRHSEGTALNKFISKEKDKRGIKDAPKTKTLTPIPPPSSASSPSMEPDTPHTPESRLHTTKRRASHSLSTSPTRALNTTTLEEKIATLEKTMAAMEKKHCKEIKTLRQTISTQQQKIESLRSSSEAKGDQAGNTPS